MAPDNWKCVYVINWTVHLTLAVLHLCLLQMFSYRPVCEKQAIRLFAETD
jgi:hypothetical protein